MALKGGSAKGIGMTDLAHLVAAFEETNSVQITLTGRIIKQEGLDDLQWEAKAWETKVTHSGRQLLASAKVRCGEKRLVTMEAVVLQLLYALDFMLGTHELEQTRKR